MGSIKDVQVLLDRIADHQAVIAHRRDELRDIRDELSSVIESLDEGLEGLTDGEREIRDAIDKMSELL